MSMPDISLSHYLVGGRQAVMDGYLKESRNGRAGIIDLACVTTWVTCLQLV